jgi:hypothetical protein
VVPGLVIIRYQHESDPKGVLVSLEARDFTSQGHTCSILDGVHRPSRHQRVTAGNVRE